MNINYNVHSPHWELNPCETCVLRSICMIYFQTVRAIESSNTMYFLKEYAPVGFTFSFNDGCPKGMYKQEEKVENVEMVEKKIEGECT